ncbi:hypothetical protein [Luteolibacter sp. LG18]|uniref:hypothetical protein n=1 Tax=Luteolibacter sp. LG18 TaxID=2819286 RepID=UPI002B31727B|nr:hypothetical protein llg_13220 [Luteolibacter sp. LG18]
MKRIAISLAAAALAFFGATPNAEARHYSSSSRVYVSSYARCGCPIYVQRYVAFYDGWGRPVWRTRILPIRHTCGWGRPAPYYGSYSRSYTPYYGGYTYGGYGYRRPGIVIRF